MKFLCLTLCQGEVCTDDADDDANADTNDDGQSMIDKPNEPITIMAKMTLTPCTAREHI